MTWLVRLGTERGAGRYVSRVTETHDVRHMDWVFWSRPKQIDARRFELRDLAEDYARDYGGRVVRLRRRR